MELVSVCCNRDFTLASSYGLGWYKYTIATQWYQFDITDAWWFSLSTMACSKPHQDVFLIWYISHYWRSRWCIFFDACKYSMMFSARHIYCMDIGHYVNRREEHTGWKSISLRYHNIANRRLCGIMQIKRIMYGILSIVVLGRWLLELCSSFFFVMSIYSPFYAL